MEDLNCNKDKKNEIRGLILHLVISILTILIFMTLLYIEDKKFDELKSEVTELEEYCILIKGGVRDCQYSLDYLKYGGYNAEYPENYTGLED